MRTQDLHMEARTAAARCKPDRSSTAHRGRVDDSCLPPETHLVKDAHPIEDLWVVCLVSVLQNYFPYTLSRN